MESDPFMSQRPSKAHAEHHAELQAPHKSSRHRYIIGTPPKSEPPHVKVLSDGFSRKANWREEHTHIHIYVPSSTADPNRSCAQHMPARTPPVEGWRVGEDKQSIVYTPTPVPKNPASIDRSDLRYRTIVKPRRSRRHRRSFQD
jgi:hypothetical protein